MKGAAKELRFSKEGFVKLLGHLEQEIMDVLWAKKEASGKEVFEEIRRCRDIALTTVLTVLERLTKKGLVRKFKGESVFIYTAALTKEEFAKEVSQEVFKGIFEISRSGAFASFVDMLASTDPGELERLSSLIEKKRKELEAKAR